MRRRNDAESLNRVLKDTPYWAARTASATWRRNALSWHRYRKRKRDSAVA